MGTPGVKEEAFSTILVKNGFREDGKAVSDTPVLTKALRLASSAYAKKEKGIF